MKRITTVFLLATAVMLFGCKSATTTQSPQGVVQVVNALPRTTSALLLKREYREELKPGIMLNITSSQTPYKALYVDGIEFHDELVQKDHDGHVFFDCDNVADKILDRELVPVVEKECNVIHALAMNFWKTTPPTEFEDDQGHVWQLVQKGGGGK